MSSAVQREEHFGDFDREFYNAQIRPLTTPLVKQFQRILQRHAFLHCLFIGLIFIEVTYLILHAIFLLQSFAFALHLAFLFASVFSYLALRLYLQAHKIDKWKELRIQLTRAVSIRMGNSLEQTRRHLILAHAYCQLAADLQGMEYRIYPRPSWPDGLASLIEKWSGWCHWRDIHTMKELLLHACVEEQIQLVRLEPTDLAAHAGLANAYVMLSGLYVDPRTVDGLHDDQWIPPQKYGEEFKRKFRQAAQRAIEEFKILSDYAPEDPWVYAQLAYSYHDLQMPCEEIQAYETLLTLCPDDKDILFKLGKLYFEQGLNAKGLQIYESLKRTHYKRAEHLIHLYGAYRAQSK